MAASGRGCLEFTNREFTRTPEVGRSLVALLNEAGRIQFDRAEAAVDALKSLHIRLRELAAQWEAYAPDMIGGDEMYQCAADLLAVLDKGGVL